MKNLKYQQGDVLLYKLEKLPENVEKIEIKNGEIVLAEGEVTGHKHTITGEGIELFEDNGVLFLKSNQKKELKHNEHNPINIDAGLYEIGIVREYNYDEEAIKKIAD